MVADQLSYKTTGETLGLFNILKLASACNTIQEGRKEVCSLWEI